MSAPAPAPASSPSPSLEASTSASASAPSPTNPKRSSVSSSKDPFGYMHTYHTDTQAQSDQLGDVAIKEPEYTADELTQMETLRSNVAAMLKAAQPLSATAEDYPGGMHQHWTTYWPQGKGHALYNDKHSATDADETQWPQHELIRFLRAREYNMKKATKMYFHYKRWRLLFGASHICALPTMPFEPLIQSILSHSYHKWDKHGRPLYIQQSGKIDPVRFTTEVSVEQISVGHTFFTEEMKKRLEVGSKMTGKRVLEIVNIIDIAGLGLSSRKMLPIFSVTSYIDQNFYPETLGCLYMINAPSFFPVVYSICKTFLSAATQRKIKILGTKYQQVLLDDLGPDCLPVQYGGTCVCEGGCCPEPTGPGFKDPSKEELEEETITIKAGQEHKVDLIVIPTNATIKPSSSSSDSSSSSSSAPSPSAASVASSFTDELLPMEVVWNFIVTAKDIDFTVVFIHTPTDESQTPDAPLVVQATSRITASTTPTCGVYSNDKPGVLQLIFSNSYSRWNSKVIKLTTGNRLKMQ